MPKIGYIGVYLFSVFCMQQKSIIFATLNFCYDISKFICRRSERGQTP